MEESSEIKANEKANMCGVHNCSNQAIFICKKSKILSCYKCKILYFSLEKTIDIVSLHKAKDSALEVLNFLKVMKVCGSGLHIQTSYPNFNAKVDRFEQKVKQLEQKLLNLNDISSVLEVSIINDQIVEVKKTIDRSEVMLQFSLHGIQLSSDLMHIKQDLNLEQLNAIDQTDDKSRNVVHRRNRSLRNKSQGTEISSETDREETKLHSEDSNSIGEVFKRVLDSYSDKLKNTEVEVPLLASKHQEINIKEYKEKSSSEGFNIYIKILIFLNIVLITLLASSLYYVIQSQTLMTERLVEIASKIPTSISVDPSLFQFVNVKSENIIEDDSNKSLSEVHTETPVITFQEETKEMKQERIRLEKIHKYIDFYDSKTGKKSSKNETEFEFETTFNYDIDLEIRKELMYKPFKKIKKLEILNCRNREKNFTTFLFAAPFAENFIIGGAENDIPLASYEPANAIERISTKASNLTYFSRFHFTNREFERFVKGSSGTETVVFNECRIETNKHLNLFGPYYKTKVFKFEKACVFNTWKLVPFKVENIIKKVSECDLRKSLREFVVTGCDISTELLEGYFKQYGMSNITVVSIP